MLPTALQTRHLSKIKEGVDSASSEGDSASGWYRVAFPQGVNATRVLMWQKDKKDRRKGGHADSLELLCEVANHT